MVKFKIKRLGAIRDSSIELSQLMIFSGESGLGKSYISFLVHYIYILLVDNNRFMQFFEESGYDLNVLLKEKKTGDVLLKIDSVELLSWINKDAISYIGYLLGHNDIKGEIDIEIPLKGESLDIMYDEEIVGINNNEEVYYKISLNEFIYRIPANVSQIGVYPLAGLLRAVFSEMIFGDFKFPQRTFLMPPSRGALVELNERPAFSSGMYEEFFDGKIDLNRPKMERLEPTDILLQCLSEINMGDVQFIDGKVMYNTNGIEIPVTAAASSIKELAPLSLFFKKHPIAGSSILFEEPEAHLHPDRQIKVADLVGYVVGEGCHMQITTHSDYFIRRLNNLILLYKLKEKSDVLFEEFCEKWRIKKECLINPVKIGAYVLKRRDDGTTQLVKQHIDDDGIPFDSFYDVIEKDILTSRELRKIIEK